ncbi:hypothetical protein J7E87_21065 [Streptomyces sp. ISL-1]|nr:hypothetical protein [Streptomyces sp. ISL-1]
MTTSACSTALRQLRPRGTGHDPGRIATDLAVMIADGGETITDLVVLRDQSMVRCRGLHAHGLAAARRHGRGRTRFAASGPR